MKNALDTKPDTNDINLLDLWEIAVKTQDPDLALLAHGAADGNRGDIMEAYSKAKKLGIDVSRR